MIKKIENSLYKISNGKINIEYAGRTDSGVHATHQVIAFEIKWNHSKLKLENAINAYLPDDILVNNIKKVPSLFHPRKDAISRTYEYKISQAKVKDLFNRNYVYHYPYKLNISKIESALKILEGRHDFKNFCKSENISDNCIRDLYYNYRQKCSLTPRYPRVQCWFQCWFQCWLQCWSLPHVPGPIDMTQTRFRQDSDTPR